MAQHFLLSAAARSLSPAKVARMSERGAENVFARLRWPQTDGKPVCPRCEPTLLPVRRALPRLSRSWQSCCNPSGSCWVSGWWLRRVAPRLRL